MTQLISRIIVVASAFGIGAIVGFVLKCPNKETQLEDAYARRNFIRMVDKCDEYYKKYAEKERLMDWTSSEEVLRRVLFHAIGDESATRVHAILNDSKLDLNKKLSFVDISLFAYLLTYSWDNWDNDEILDILYHHGMEIPARPFLTQPFSKYYAKEYAEYATTIAAMHGKIKVLRWLQMHGAPMPSDRDIEKIRQCLEAGVPCDPKTGGDNRPFDDKLISEIMKCIHPFPTSLRPTATTSCDKPLL